MRYINKLFAVPAALLLLAVTHVFAGAIERISDDGFGNEGNCYSDTLYLGVNHISADGRFVVYSSCASNLVLPDPAWWDVYVYDRVTGLNERASAASDGTQADRDSGSPSISADGRFVAFSSNATNLVTPDSNGFLLDIYLHDRDTGVIERVSIASDGTQGDASSYFPSISADGRFVVFSSEATNLVTPDSNGFLLDIYLHDRDTGVTERVSIASDGTQGDASSYFPSISAHGRHVAFLSNASNLSTPDANGLLEDIFIHDRDTGLTERVNIASDGTQGNAASRYPSISADGRFVVYSSRATNLVAPDTNGSIEDIYVRDRDIGVTERVSVACDGTQGNDLSVFPSISADGRYVAFTSLATNLVTHNAHGTLAHVYVRDRTLGGTFRMSTASDGTEANDHTFYGTISPDGTLVAFSSYATNLVPTGIANPQWTQAFIKETSFDPTDCEPLPVAIDVKPGNADEIDPLNLRSRGSLPVAIFSAADFDATTIDVATLELGDPLLAARAYVVDPDAQGSQVEDVNQDGLADLVVHFSASELVDGGAIDANSTSVVLTGSTLSGEAIEGTDQVRIVGGGQMN